MILDHVITNTDPHNVWLRAAKVDHRGASSMEAIFHEAIVDYEIGDIQDFLINVFCNIFCPFD